MTQLDRLDSPSLGSAVSRERGFLYQPATSCHHQAVVWQVEISNRDAVQDLFRLVQLQQVHDGPATTVPSQFGQSIDFLPVDLSLVGEEEQVGMRAGYEKMFDRVFLVRPRPSQAPAASPLGAVDAQRGPLDIPVMADGDGHRFLGDQRVQVDVANLLPADFGPPLIPVLVTYRFQVGLDDVPDVILVFKDVKILRNLLK